MDGRRKTTRGKSAKHAGVILSRRLLPSGSVSWRARWLDPDTKELAWETLPKDLTTEELRADWATKKVQENAARQRKLDGGAPVKANKALSAVVEQYFTDRSARLGERTASVYKEATDEFLRWAGETGLESADDLTETQLARFRVWSEKQLSRKQKKGGERFHAHITTPQVRDPVTVNRVFRTLGTVFNHLCEQGLVPMLSGEGIRKGLKKLPVEKKIVKFLDSDTLMQIVDAVKLHDEDTFDLTREEKERGLTKGITPRYDPILPFFATTLLSGMRAGEAQRLEWRQINFKAGKIRVKFKRRERDVNLIVSPLLRELLTTLRLRAGKNVYVFQAPPVEGKPAASYDRSRIDSARKRVKASDEDDGYGSPFFSWQLLRSTCATFLTNSTGLFGDRDTTLFKSARQLGHTVAVAEKHYWGVADVATGVQTLEAAMGIEAKLREALGLMVNEPAREKAAK
ncbi:site-specific integrase [bacterium]|nr:site-specific integrase [bacterium]